MNRTEIAGNDGRTARRDRNRDTVLDATIELFAEGAILPGAIDVAERSGISLRSVYRYFEDMDELVRTAIERSQERTRDLYRLDGLGDGPVAERVQRIVDQRITIYEELAPVIRATIARAPSNEMLRRRLTEARDLLSWQIEQMFAPELLEVPLRADREVIAALDTLLGFAAIEHLRTVRGLSVAQTRRVLLRAVGALVGGSD